MGFSLDGGLVRVMRSLPFVCASPTFSYFKTDQQQFRRIEQVRACGKSRGEVS